MEPTSSSIREETPSPPGLPVPRSPVSPSKFSAEACYIENSLVESALYIKYRNNGGNVGVSLYLTPLFTVWPANICYFSLCNFSLPELLDVLLSAASVCIFSIISVTVFSQ